MGSLNLYLGADSAAGISAYLFLQRGTGKTAEMVFLLVLSGASSALLYNWNMGASGGAFIRRIKT